MYKREYQRNHLNQYQHNFKIQKQMNGVLQEMLNIIWVLHLKGYLKMENKSKCHYQLIPHILRPLIPLLLVKLELDKINLNPQLMKNLLEIQPKTLYLLLIYMEMPPLLDKGLSMRLFKCKIYLPTLLVEPSILLSIIKSDSLLHPSKLDPVYIVLIS